MEKVLVLAIVFGGIVLVLSVIGGTILMGIRIIKGGISRKGPGREAEEVRLLQDLYQGLLKMEKRVEALETILLDQERKDRPS